MTTAIYFDCDGTLCSLSTSHSDLFTIACDHVGIDGDTGPVAATYTEEFFRAFEAFDPDPYLAGSRAAFEHHGIDADPEQFADALVTAEIEHTVIEDGTQEVLDSLATGASVGVLTNGVADIQRRKLERHDLFDRFDAYVPSYEVGSHKPSQELFEAAQERLPADEYVYVGDSIDDDIQPAREAGFLPVHLDRTNEPGAVGIDSFATLGRVADSL